MIKKFIYRTFLFCFIAISLLVLLLLVSSEKVKSRNFKNAETKSNTLIIKENEQFDLLFLGISHARNFSRFHNHERVEKILNKKMINLGQGGAACGVNEQLFYLKYFYSKGNSAKKIVYVLTPPMLTSDQLPIASNTFDSEVFSFDFLFQYMCFDSENKSERILQYCQSKLRSNWINLKPGRALFKTDSLLRIDPNEVKKGFILASGEKIDMNRFHKSCVTIEKTIQVAQKHHSKIVFFIPPALFGKWPEHSITLEFAKKMKRKYGVPYADFAESVVIPNYYYDHHHLNSKGIDYFTKKYLKPFLDSN